MKVELNYDVIEKNAMDFNEYSDEMQTINDGINNRGLLIKKNWVSSNSDSFYALLEQLTSDMKIDINKMKRYSNIILGVKDKFKDTDLKYAREMTVDKKDIEVKL